MISKGYFIKFADGNPGAGSCLSRLQKFDQEKAGVIWSTLQKLEIKGWRIWAFFADVCDQDFDKMFEICSEVPGKIIVEAVSKTDYSGKSIINEYFNNSFAGLTYSEMKEREELIRLQSSTTRPFLQYEFDRLKELNRKINQAAGSPNKPFIKNESN